MPAKRKLNNYYKKIIDGVNEIDESTELEEKKEKKQNEESKYENSLFFQKIVTNQSTDSFSECKFYFENLLIHKINPKVQQIKKQEDYINFIY